MPWRLVTGNIIPHPSPSQAPPRRRHGWLWGATPMGCPPVRRVGWEERGRGAPGEQAAGRTRGMKTVSSRTDGEGGKSKQAVAGRAAAGGVLCWRTQVFLAGVANGYTTTAAPSPLKHLPEHHSEILELREQDDNAADDTGDTASAAPPLAGGFYHISESRDRMATMKKASSTYMVEGMESGDSI